MKGTVMGIMESQQRVPILSVFRATPTGCMVDAQEKAWGWGRSRVPDTKPLTSPHLRLSLPSSPISGLSSTGAWRRASWLFPIWACAPQIPVQTGLVGSFSFSPYGPQASRATKSTATGCCLSGCMVWPQPVRTPAKHCSRAS